MMRPPRGLSSEEAALWGRIAATVHPLRPLRRGEAEPAGAAGSPRAKPKSPSTVMAVSPPRPGDVPVRPLDRHGLDGSWERKLAKAQIEPDFTIDLHGHTLDSAHARLDHGLALAIAQQARVVLVITGRPRPVDAADRGARRGAIRAKLLDWLAAGPHGARIAAVRSAHPKHGGAGALYLVLRRRG